MKYEIHSPQSNPPVSNFSTTEDEVGDPEASCKMQKWRRIFSDGLLLLLPFLS
jgi:hypothetical protein